MFNAHYSVGELTAYIRDLLTFDSRLQSVWVEGEISNFTRAASGHWYFTLKDSNAQVKCVMWRSSAAQQAYLPANGDSIQVHGAIGVYEANGVYQLYVDQMRPVGMGDLYQRFERLKAQLEADGVFDAERKRPLPAFPRAIAVVTSADAAAFQDVQNVLRRRFPLAPVYLCHCLVQGDDAPPQIVAALARANRADVDVILLVRGGGSIEDLWAFNDERVAYAIAASRVPVVSGVGHETDFTIADFAADLRAPTPSAAAELVTPNLDDLYAMVGQMEGALERCIHDCLDTLGSDLAASTRALRHVSPLARLRSLRQRTDDINTRLTTAQRGRFVLLRERMSARTAALTSADPRRLLQRGYAIVTRRDTGDYADASAPPATPLTIQFADGSLSARVEP